MGGGYETMCQQGHWTLKGVDLVEVPHRLEKGTSASENAGARREWIVRSHIGWEREQNTLYKGVETSP